MFNNSLLKAEDDDTLLTKEMKAAILEYLNDKYSDPTTDELLDMASLLDPRFKTTYIEESKVAHITARQQGAASNAVVFLDVHGNEQELKPQPAMAVVHSGLFFGNVGLVNGQLVQKAFTF